MNERFSGQIERALPEERVISGKEARLISEAGRPESNPKIGPEFVALKDKLLDLRREISASPFANEFRRQSDELVDLNNFSEDTDFDAALEETANLFYDTLSPEVASRHTRNEMKLLLEAGVLDRLRERLDIESG